MEISNNRDGDDVFLSSARVIRQPADNSCLYHSLSYCLAAEALIENVYSQNDGFQLRTSVNTFIRDNGNVNINVVYEEKQTSTVSKFTTAEKELLDDNFVDGATDEMPTTVESPAIKIQQYDKVLQERISNKRKSYPSRKRKYDGLDPAFIAFLERRRAEQSKKKRRKIYSEKVKSRMATVQVKRKLIDVQTHEETSKTMKKRREVRNSKKKKVYAIKHKKSPSAIDASLYEKNYDKESRYIVCAICGQEGSQVGSNLVDDYVELISLSGIQEKYKSLMSVHSYSTEYDKIFIEEMSKHFDDGLIKGVKTLCIVCCRELKKKSRTIEAELNIDDSDDNDGQECASSVAKNMNSYCEANQSDHIPKFAQFLGMFCGSIPSVLIGLTVVEDSMINIYSAITKVCLGGGKHYKLKGGTCYTIVNDLTSVAKQLPRMPTIDCTALMRHKNSTVGKDYTYRPYKIYSALTWLKKHNHLYAEIELVWPNYISNWQSQDAVDIPFIELTDEELEDIDEGYSEVVTSSDEYCTNTGIEQHYVHKSSKNVIRTYFYLI
jgi:hypothetical protein